MASSCRHWPARRRRDRCQARLSRSTRPADQPKLPCVPRVASSTDRRRTRETVEVLREGAQHPALERLGRHRSHSRRIGVDLWRQSPEFGVLILPGDPAGAPRRRQLPARGRAQAGAPGWMPARSPTPTASSSWCSSWSRPGSTRIGSGPPPTRRSGPRARCSGWWAPC